MPLFYENRTPELHLINPNLNEDIYALIEEAELSEEAEKRARDASSAGNTTSSRAMTGWRRWRRTSCSHFLGRGFQGKAMVVSIDKATALQDVRQGAEALGAQSRSEWRRSWRSSRASKKRIPNESDS